MNEYLRKPSRKVTHGNYFLRKALKKTPLWKTIKENQYGKAPKEQH